MFLSIQELQSVLYEYQMNDIAEGRDDILQDAIDAAISEVQTYLYAANDRRETAKLTAQQYANWQVYDVPAIFSQEGSDRNAFLLRLTKRIAAWNIVELSAPDVIYERVKERYEAAVAMLEKIAGVGDYAYARFIIPGLTSAALPPDDTNAANNNMLPFRMTSRTKFQHE